MENELDWAARAFDMLLKQSVFANDRTRKHVLEFLMTAPDSVKARVTEFEAIKEIGE